MTRLFTLALVVLVVVPSAFAQGQGLTRRLPATNDSIFAPLPLPTPNAYRSADGRPGPDYWQQRNDYRIRVALDPTTNTVSGTVALRYTNNSPEALDFLWMHLEQNLFAPESRGSLFDGTVRDVSQDVPFNVRGTIVVLPDGTASITVSGPDSL